MLRSYSCFCCCPLTFFFKINVLILSGNTIRVSYAELMSFNLCPTDLFFLSRKCHLLICIYSYAFQTNFIIEANTMNSDQTAPKGIKDRPDLDPNCLTL